MSESPEMSTEYLTAGFGGRVARGIRPAVIIVDFQRSFTDPGSPVGSQMNQALARTREVLDAARASHALIVFTVLAWGPGLHDAGPAAMKSSMASCLEDAPGRDPSRFDIDESLRRRESELVLRKRAPSAFFGTSLADVLIAHDIDTVLVCGTSTSGCVRATVVDAFSHGYPTLVPRECVSDRLQGPHEANLFDLDEKYADVISFQEGIDYLRSVREFEANLGRNDPGS